MCQNVEFQIKECSKVLQKVLVEGDKEGVSARDLLRYVTSKFYNTNEASAQQVAYDLLQLRRVESSVVSASIHSGPEKFRSRMMKPQAQLRESAYLFNRLLLTEGITSSSNHDLDYAQDEDLHEFVTGDTNIENSGLLGDNVDYIKRRRKPRVIKYSFEDIQSIL
ncbi:hypothetical protein BDB01DRAFT_832785 [Pilobolus umbonatus]|nr:hypothetical protein BDB01DRAFT_832785 [Pilobolus umbonatus]